MKYSNDNKLIEPLYKWLSADDYVKTGDYSATSLIKPHQQYVLEKRHDDEIVIDVASLFKARMGTAIHTALERWYTPLSYKTELDKYTISGTPDHYSDGVITDFKYTSTYSAYNKLTVKKWTQQLNIYAWLMFLNNTKVTKLQIQPLYYDWSATRQKRTREYPGHAMERKYIELWPFDATEEFIWWMVELKERAMDTGNDENLAEDFPCTEEDMWTKPHVYAVMKEGRKSALRLLTTKEDAEEYMASKGGDRIDERLGENTRCENFCSVKQFCNQYKLQQGDN